MYWRQWFSCIRVGQRNTFFAKSLLAVFVLELNLSLATYGISRVWKLFESALSYGA